LINPAIEKFLNEHRDEYRAAARSNGPELPDGRHSVEIVSVSVDWFEGGPWLEWLFRPVSATRIVAYRQRCGVENWPFVKRDLARCGVHVDDPIELLAAVDELAGKRIYIWVCPDFKGRRVIRIDRLLEVSK
jgi:hypothetical protein